jgi:HAE1 family hydrophobic/amphiphilic exporter-1
VLKHWDERQEPENQIQAVVDRLNGRLGQIEDAVVFAVRPPPIQGLGATGGNQMELQDVGGIGPATLQLVALDMIQQGAAHPALAGMNTTFRSGVPELFLEVDREKAKRLDVPLDVIFNTCRPTSARPTPTTSTSSAEPGRSLSRPTSSSAPSATTSPGSRSAAAAARWSRFRPCSGHQPGRVEHRPPLQPLQLGVDHRQRGPGLQLGSVDRGHGGDSRELASSRNELRVDGRDLPADRRRRRRRLHLRAGHRLRLPLPRRPVRELVAAAGRHLHRPHRGAGRRPGHLLRGLDNNVYMQIGLVLLIGLASKSAILIVEFANQLNQEGKSVFEAATSTRRSCASGRS